MLFEYIPEDIVYNILDRIPKKHLLRFRCVSKHSYRLISDFIKSKSRRMILLNEQPFTVMNDNDHVILNVSPPCRILQNRCVRILGTFNGIVLMADLRDHMILFLYNPFTGAVKDIPDPSSHDHGSCNSYAYGFGYGTAVDDLKIVRIRRESGKHGSRPFDIFSIRTWSWNTNTLMIDCSFDYQYNGIFVNGCLYWMVYGPTRVILVLDLKNMVFSKIEPPAKLGELPLGTLKGNLCAICCSKTNDIEKELWVMKEHGAWKSWSKVSTLTSLLRGNCLWTSITKSMCILDEGKLVMQKGENEVIIYDMLKDSYKKVKSFTSVGTQAIEYMESCVSPSIWQGLTCRCDTDRT